MAELDRGRRAYELYQSRQHITWGAVARSLGARNHQTVMQAARQYARENGLRWPLARSAAGAPYGNIGRDGYRLYRDTGMTWAQVAERLGAASESSAYICARNHARRNGLRWPIERDR